MKRGCCLSKMRKKSIDEIISEGSTVPFFLSCATQELYPRNGEPYSSVYALNSAVNEVTEFDNSTKAIIHKLGLI